MDLDADHELRAELEDAFLTNEVAAPRMARLMLRAHNCKVSGLSGMVRIAKSSKKNKDQTFKTHWEKTLLGAYGQIPSSIERWEKPFASIHATSSFAIQNATDQLLPGSFEANNPSSVLSE